MGNTKALALLAVLVIGTAFAAFFVIRFYADGLGAGSGLQTSSQYGKEELVAYALSLINLDRQVSNAPNVTLSSVVSAQMHAEDMLSNGYFSHWDLEGYKPYVRYTLAGGRGAVTENIATSLGSSLDPKQAIKDLEWSMMNDDAESNWGHKNNIIDMFHNKVSIGIAYDTDNFYLVQDFEDDYVKWTNLSASQTAAILAGSFASSELTIKQVDVYFDKLQNLTTNDLENAPYNSSYDPGTFVGSVSDSKLVLLEGIFVSPNIWAQSGQTFQINFSLDAFFSRSGRGIYTIRLWSDSGECLTSHSVFFSG